MSDTHQPDAPQGPGSQTPAAPPPHPYAEPAPSAVLRPGTGKLGIAAMVIGLVALLTSVVAMLYIGILVIVGAILGLAGVVLGALSLGFKQRPLAPAIVGLCAGTLAVLVAILAALWFLVAPGLDTAEAPEPAPLESTPEEMTFIEWPRNMETGSIAFGEGMQPMRSEAPDDNAEPLPRSFDREAGPVDIQLYVDYNCPVCAVFEDANAETLEEAVGSGEAALELYPLTFLDRMNPEVQYSSRAAAALSCVVDSEPEQTWAVHQHLLSPEVQPGEPGLSDDELITELGAATGGLGEEAQSCIASNRFVPLAQALNSWVFDHSVPDAADPELRVEGTPFAVVNGEPYTGPPDDGKQFRDLLESQGVNFD